MTMPPIHPSLANDTGNGQMTIRVEGDDVAVCVDAQTRGEIIALDEPAGTYWKITGCALHDGPIGFFDVVAVEAPAPSDDATEATDPGTRPRRRAAKVPD